MADRTWATPVANTLRSLAPNPAPSGSQEAICTAWTGGCVDQDRGEYILPANGGHTDYAGNEVYAVALRKDSPTWVRLTDPSSASGGTLGGNTKGDFGDGKMRSVHGWHRACFGNGRVWYAGMDGMYITGAWSTACWSFNRGSLGWTYHGLGLPTLGGNVNGEAGCASYDRVGNRVWSSVGAGSNSLGQSIYSIDASSGVVSQHKIALQAGRPRWSALAHDLRLWILGCGPDGVLELVDLNNPTQTIVKTPTGSPSGLTDGAGAVYHAPSRAILTWNSYGANLRKLTIPSNPLTGSWVWSQVSPSSANSVAPDAAPAQGTYSKFNLIEDMGNGQSALVVVNSTSGPVYVYKLPAAGV
jgi:hypothetical protein